MKRSTNSMTRFFPKNHLIRSSSSSMKNKIKKRTFDKTNNDKFNIGNKATNLSNSPKESIKLKANSPMNFNNQCHNKLFANINTFN